MPASPIHVVVKYALFTPGDARRARQQAGVAEHDFSWVPVARRLATERMQARGKALWEMVTEVVRGLQPPVQVGTVLLDNQPSDQGLRQRWLVRLLGGDLPGGFCEVPVPLDIEADAARHVLPAQDEIRHRILAGVKFPRGAQ